MVQLSVRESSILDLLSHLESVTAYALDVIALAEKTVREVSGSWAGGANMQFQLLHEEWSVGASEMQEALAGLREHLVGVQDSYDGANESLSGIWGRGL